MNAVSSERKTREQSLLEAESVTSMAEIIKGQRPKWPVENNYQVRAFNQLDFHKRATEKVLVHSLPEPGLAHNILVPEAGS